MSDFLKFAFEVLSQVVYNIAGVIAAAIKLLVTGWRDYFTIFFTYFGTLSLVAKILSILLMLILIAIPILAVILLVRYWMLRRRLRGDKEDNAELYREIGRLNRQVLDLIEEKNKILALKVNAMGGTERIPYMGASALTDDILPTVGNVTGKGGTAAAGVPGEISSAQITIANGTVNDKSEETASVPDGSRFPKLTLVDMKYHDYIRPVFDDEVTLEQLVENYRLFACSQMHLYYTPEIIRRFVAGMASSKLLILEGISGTGKTSLPHSFSRFLCNPATMVSVQPSFRDRTELLGYFNEFSKRFNETEFLRALYEANYREEPSMVILDEMNLARIEYYFAEMLSILEMPSHDEWVLDLVPTAWEGDPVKLFDGKIQVPDSIWFIGTANNDDSTFTITDKVYDRAMPIELNERADAFTCDPQPACRVTSVHLQEMFAKAKREHPISEATLTKLDKLDGYLQTRFKLAFGNRIIKQMYDFIPVYVACGGKELDGMDYIVARKVLKKLESLNVTFVRDEIRGLIEYIEKVFGKSNMTDSKAYLTRIQNLY
ncbi:MAG: AAA family ATPase [Clostridiales bacterium]|nr:AAA family ATPase [Clostridiales bacterium]